MTVYSIQSQILCKELYSSLLSYALDSRNVI